MATSIVVIKCKDDVSLRSQFSKMSSIQSSGGNHSMTEDDRNQFLFPLIKIIAQRSIVFYVKFCSQSWITHKFWVLPSDSTYPGVSFKHPKTLNIFVWVIPKLFPLRIFNFSVPAHWIKNTNSIESVLHMKFSVSYFKLSTNFNIAQISWSIHDPQIKRKYERNNIPNYQSQQICFDEEPKN